MKLPDIENMPPVKRRQILKALSVALSLPFLPKEVRIACGDLLGGTAMAAEIDSTLPTYFIEINLRDQWDFGHVFVAPGLATNSNLRRGEGRKAALFYKELFKEENNIFLTEDSQVLKPHLDSIALIETCELSKGAIHGHEAANATRSPGRDYVGGAGRLPMWELEGSGVQGNESHYGTTPTPACLHNYFQKQIDPTLRNGIAMKHISRILHTVYHFSAGLERAQLERIRTISSLFKAFPSTIGGKAVDGLTADQSQFLVQALKKADARHLSQAGYSQKILMGHGAQQDELNTVLQPRVRPVLNLALSPTEKTFWSQGVPGRNNDRNFENDERPGIWEMVAYASKLIASDAVRTIAMEFDFTDVHGSRGEGELKTQGLQTALPLARLIENLKAAGVYDRTLIALYSTDGGRATASDSSGDEGKNAVMLAGGMIKGGYYGDIRVSRNEGDGHVFSYHAPDLLTGIPNAQGAIGRDRDKRIAGAHVWRTVMKALNIPDSLCDQFADVKGVKPLPFLLRNIG